MAVKATMSWWKNLERSSGLPFVHASFIARTVDQISCLTGSEKETIATSQGCVGPGPFPWQRLVMEPLDQSQAGLCQWASRRDMTSGLTGGPLAGRPRRAIS